MNRWAAVRRTDMTFTLLYQVGIANVFRSESISNPQRVYQGDYRSAELICHGALLAGADLEVMHYDMEGDALLAGKDGWPQWMSGKGSLFSESKHPYRAWK